MRCFAPFYRPLFILFPLFFLVTGCSRRQSAWISDAEEAFAAGDIAQGIVYLQSGLNSDSAVKFRDWSRAMRMAKEQWQPNLAADLFGRGLEEMEIVDRRFLAQGIEVWQMVGRIEESAEELAKPRFLELPMPDRAWLRGRQAILEDRSADALHFVVVLNEIEHGMPRAQQLEALVALRSRDAFSIVRAALLIKRLALAPNQPLAMEAITLAATLPGPLLTKADREACAELLVQHKATGMPMRPALWAFWEQLEHVWTPSDLEQFGPSDANEVLILGRMLVNQSQFESALNLLGKWNFDTEKSAGMALALQTEACMRLSKFSEAHGIIDASALISDSEKKLWHSWVALAADDTAEALRIVDSLKVEELPEANLPRLLAFARRAQQMNSRAISASAYLKYCRRTYADGTATIQLLQEGIVALMRDKRDREALSLLQWSLVLQPGNMAVINNVAYMELLLEEPLTVPVTTMESVLAGSEVPHFQSTWALYLIRQKQFEEAISILEVIDPESVPVAPVLHGWALMELGRVAEAKKIMGIVDQEQLISSEQQQLDRLLN